MDQVRAHYGDDALIISTNKVGNKTEMICAVEEPQAQTGTSQQSVTESAKSLDISEATSTVASLLNRVAADAAAEGLPATNLGAANQMSASLESSARNSTLPWDSDRMLAGLGPTSCPAHQLHPVTVQLLNQHPLRYQTTMTCTR